MAAERVYRHTDVSYCKNVHELRATLAHALPALRWRHHGIGVLQAYLVEGASEVRAHIWHPDLLRIGAEREGQIHDHRFTLHSTVLAGAIHHDEYLVDPQLDGDWQRWAVLNARRGSAPPKPVGGPVCVDVLPGVIRAGMTYRFPRGAFHRSHVDALAVTLVTKADQVDTPAMLLCPTGTTPRHGFVDNGPVDVEAFVAMARAALLEGEASRG